MKPLVQVEDKGTYTHPINITTHEDNQLVEVKSYSDDAIQTMKVPSEVFITNSTTSLLEVNQEIATHMIRENETRRTPYRHLNHKSSQLSPSTYLSHS